MSLIQARHKFLVLLCACLAGCTSHHVVKAPEPKFDLPMMDVQFALEALPESLLSTNHPMPLKVPISVELPAGFRDGRLWRCGRHYGYPTPDLSDALTFQVLEPSYYRPADSIARENGYLKSSGWKSFLKNNAFNKSIFNKDTLGIGAFNTDGRIWLWLVQ